MRPRTLCISHGLCQTKDVTSVVLYPFKLQKRPSVIEGAKVDMRCSQQIMQLSQPFPFHREMVRANRDACQRCSRADAGYDKACSLGAEVGRPAGIAQARPDALPEQRLAGGLAAQHERQRLLRNVERRPLCSCNDELACLVRQARAVHARVLHNRTRSAGACISTQLKHSIVYVICYVYRVS